MEHLFANFYPAKETHETYKGKATITVADAVRLNDISVFENISENGEKHLNLRFPGYGEGEDARSYVTPKSKEAYAAMVEVVKNAMESEKHFAYEKGSNNPTIKVSGKLVEEPYADGRFSVDIGDTVTLHGLTTRHVEHTKEGKDASFNVVDMPNAGGTYEKDGKTIYNKAFDLKEAKWTDKDGNEQKKDWEGIIKGMIFNEKKALKEKKPDLESQINGANEKRDNQKTNAAPVKEEELAF